MELLYRSSTYENWHDSLMYICIGSRKSYDSLTLLIGVDMLKYNPENCGEFVERDNGCWFTYRKTEDAWALSYGLTHEIDVLDGVRFAIIKKTCANICTSEDDKGKPILENWKFKKHTVFY